ncbi:MarR family transcriptional regulator [Streptomyces shenzhenensis]|jgi:anti-anti-sigma regulatory factor|uniref:MarR family transcriptional regulator n=1 Tax=Streptomyces TaxID=1883 RepID=UPI000A94882A|nr:MarR family transcriptional regulator [Streptomyces sp. TP-A0356]
MKTTRQGTITFPVQPYGQFLFTRAAGATARADLEERLRRSDARALLTIDFTGVTAMTNSFADEFLGKFYTLLAAENAVEAVQLGGLNEETRDAVNVCLQRRKQFAVDAESRTLLGDAEVLADTYRCARELNTFRAAELAEELHISLPNANNRLKRLLEAGALRRERSAGPDRGGKEFIYSVPA